MYFPITLVYPQLHVNIFLQYFEHFLYFPFYATLFQVIICRLAFGLSSFGGSDREEAGFGGHQLVADLGEPGGVGEVAGRHHRQALAAGPQGEVLEVAVAAGGAGVLGVDVEIGVEGHWQRPGGGQGIQ